MKFVHTADWQIGMKAVQVGEVAQRVREERFAAARRVIGLAHDCGAEFLLVAGDTFEDNAVDRVAVQRVADIIGSFRGPVFLIPGNHDPPVAGSVWDHAAWSDYPHVHIFRQPEVVELADGLLFACPLCEKHSPHDPTRSIQPDATRQTIRIGLSHGTIEGVSDDPTDHPIPRDTCETRSLDYLALGHWHSTAMFAEGRIAYSGAHETTKFGERNSGNTLVVDIEKPGSAPKIEIHRTGGLTWLTLDRTVTQSDDLAATAAFIDEIDDPASTLIEVSLAGVISAADNAAIERIDVAIRARFLWGRLDASRLAPTPRDDSWLAELPNGPIREAAARLAESANIASLDPNDTETAVLATRALRELYAMLTEVGA